MQVGVKRQRWRIERRQQKIYREEECNDVSGGEKGDKWEESHSRVWMRNVSAQTCCIWVLLIIHWPWETTKYNRGPHVSWWMRLGLQCQLTQRSASAWTNHSMTAPLSMANTNNDAIYPTLMLLEDFFAFY